MGLGKLMRVLLAVGNVICLILAVLIMCLSLGYWHEYTGGAISILVAIFGLFVVCIYNHLIIIGYAALVGVDILILLANGIFLAVLKSGYADFCFSFDGDKSPPWGCNDWRNNGYYQRATGVMVCLFISVIVRALNFASACLLARAVYDGDEQYNGGIDDPRKPDTHDMGERGRQF